MGIPAVARHFEGHDLVVAFGAAIFRHHEFMEGDYLPAGSELWAVTSDADEAARAPLGHILIGDPADAMVRLAAEVPATSRPPVPASEPLSHPDAAGPAFTAKANIDALNVAKTDSTVIAHEWTSAERLSDRFDLSRPGSATACGPRRC